MRKHRCCVIPVRGQDATARAVTSAGSGVPVGTGRWRREARRAAGFVAVAELGGKAAFPVFAGADRNARPPDQPAVEEKRLQVDELRIVHRNVAAGDGAAVLVDDTRPVLVELVQEARQEVERRDEARLDPNEREEAVLVGRVGRRFEVQGLEVAPDSLRRLVEVEAGVDDDLRFGLVEHVPEHAVLVSPPPFVGGPVGQPGGVISAPRPRRERRFLDPPPPPVP